MKFNILIFFFLIYNYGFTQIKSDSISNYLEDQLYITAYKNNFLVTPTNYKSDGFSNGISFGFIKDIPINEQRNKGFGIGLGLAFNSFKNNLKLIENNGAINVLTLNQEFTTNKITTKAIEFPFEYRWRTSTADKYKFWRIYSGVKFSYLYKTDYIFTDAASNYTIKNPEIVNKFQYGLTLNAGYNIFNLYTYYGLKPFYKEFNINSEKSNIKEIKFGLIIYIL